MSCAVIFYNMLCGSEVGFWSKSERKNQYIPVTLIFKQVPYLYTLIQEFKLQSHRASFFRRINICLFIQL